MTGTIIPLTMTNSPVTCCKHIQHWAILGGPEGTCPGFVMGADTDLKPGVSLELGG